LLLCVLGVYNIAFSRLRQSISDNYTFFCALEYVSAFLLPVIILTFVNSMFPFQRRKLYRGATILVSFVCGAIILWASVGGVIVLAKAFFIVQGLGFVLVGLTITRVAWAAYRNVPLARTTLVSFIIFSGSFFVDLLSSLDLLPHKVAMNMYGNLALIAAFGYILLRQFLAEREHLVLARATAEQYRNLFEEMILGFSLFSTKRDSQLSSVSLAFVHGNQAFCKMLEASIEQILGKSIQELLPSQSQQDLALLLKAAETGESLHLESSFPDLRGFFEVKAYVPFEGFITIIWNDVTERIKGESDRAKMQSQLIHSEKLATVGTLAAGVAHEINNPLAIALGSAEMLREYIQEQGGEDATVAKYFEREKRALDRIAVIVRGLRTYARADTNAIEPVDLHVAITDTLVLCESIFEKEGISIERELSACTSIFAGNTGKIQQVIMNLITNARDALNDVKLQRSARLRLKTTETETHIVCTVSDNGTGISKEVILRMFDPFFTTKAPGKGTGLGLSISHSIVAEFGGSMSCESVEGEGTAFTISLPKHRG
jgi:signal transduction histidine kinase